MTPKCTEYESTLQRTLSLTSSDRRERAISDLRQYLREPFRGGAVFDRLIDHEQPNEFTEADCNAVSKLNVSVLQTTKAWLTGEGRAEIGECLEAIPADLDLSEVTGDRYDALLGEASPAWRVWMLIADQQKGAGHAGRWVTAGKLLHGKRPRLIPIFDVQAVKPVLNVSSANVWEAFWCTFQRSEVRDRIAAIRSAVPAASHLSILRVLDIVVWMSARSSTDS